MRHRTLRLTIALLIMAFFAQTSAVHAHDKDPRGGHENAQMKKLHAMMPMFSLSLAYLEIAITKGDVTAATLHGNKMLEAIPDLKKSKPHKNLKQYKQFVAFATSLETTLSATIDLTTQGNFSGAKTSFTKVEAICAACHEKFRD